MTETHAETLATETEALILSAIRGLSFGSVEVTVHNRQIVQIETREKHRFDLPSTKTTRSTPR